MTREKAIECNKNLRMYMKLSDKNQPYKFLEENYIALDMAIKALEQEPCEDCISRQAVLDAIEELKKILFDRVVVLNKVRDRVLELPPVTPQPKTDVLDKIRAELQENINYNKKMNYQGIVTGLLLALDIIDKYKAESKE